MKSPFYTEIFFIPVSAKNQRNFSCCIYQQEREMVLLYSIMNFLNFNGKLIDAATPVIGADNRGLRFGDGLFETFKYVNNELLLFDEHIARLFKGMNSLQIEIPKHFTPLKIHEQVIQLVNKNRQKKARIRLTIVRGNGGLYDAENNNPIYLIQSWELPDANGMLNVNGLQLCIYNEARKMADHFSNLKHNNYLPYFMRALEAKKNKCNDAIILNNHGRVCDSTIANIFIIRDGAVFTPALTEGCIAGIMRKFILQKLRDSGFPITETSISTDDLLQADEVFLSNSIYNIRWVAGIDNISYTNTITTGIILKLQQTNPDIFC